MIWLGDVMKLILCEFFDEVFFKEVVWGWFVDYVVVVKLDVVVLLEMLFCEWIFVGDVVDFD